MVFVYLGIAVVVIFLFLVIYYNRKNIFKKPKKKEKQKQSKKVEEKSENAKSEDTKIEINDFSNPVVKEYDDINQVLAPEDEIPQKTTIEDIDDIDFRYDMLERAQENFRSEDDEVAPEGPDGSFRNIMKQRISIGSHSLASKKPSIHGDDDDYDEMISDYDFGGESASFAKRFADLPPDMKALMMSDILNRKY